MDFVMNYLLIIFILIQADLTNTVKNRLRREMLFNKIKES